MPTQTHQPQPQTDTMDAPRHDASDGPITANAGLSDARLASAIRYNRSQGYSRSRIRGFQRGLGVVVDGVIGAQTAKAVYAFQVSRPSLGNDGKIGASTAEALAGSESATSPQGEHSSALGAAEVAAAIRYNKGRGYDVDTIKSIQRIVGVEDDGSFGPETVRAIASWQGANGMTNDGKVGRGSLGRMDIDHLPPVEDENHPQPQDEDEDNGPLPEGNITANFSWSEFRSRGDNKAVPSRYRGNVRRIARALEVIRAAFGGRPMILNSGWRSPYWNGRVGGATNSQHLRGTAADIKISGVSVRRTKEVIEQLISQGKIPQGGIGVYSTFCHYDVRGTAARWRG